MPPITGLVQAELERPRQCSGRDIHVALRGSRPDAPDSRAVSWSADSDPDCPARPGNLEAFLEPMGVPKDERDP